MVRLPHVRLLQRLGLDFATPVFDSNGGIATFYVTDAGRRFRVLRFLVSSANRCSIGIRVSLLVLCTTSLLVQDLVANSRFIRVGYLWFPCRKTDALISPGVVNFPVLINLET